jgi:hypothetical protein
MSVIALFTIGIGNASNISKLEEGSNRFRYSMNTGRNDSSAAAGLSLSSNVFTPLQPGTNPVYV